MTRLYNLLFVAVISTSTVASQIPFSTHFGYDYASKSASYDAGLFNPVEDLGGLSSTEFTTLWHPDHPGYSVRIKQNGGSWCDDTVR